MQMEHARLSEMRMNALFTTIGPLTRNSFTMNERDRMKQEIDIFCVRSAVSGIATHFSQKWVIRFYDYENIRLFYHF